MSTVEAGRDLYQQHHHPAQDTDSDLQAKPGSMAWGRVLLRARQGDQEAAKVARRQANRGNGTAQAALDMADGGDLDVTGGSEVQTDNVAFGGDAA